MIAYFPTPYPDELAYSWFCRYYVHSGHLSHKMALRELYCKKSDNPSKEFIGSLNPEIREQIEKICPLENVVLNHTMYPQYARFVPLEQRKVALSQLSHENCDAHHLFPILPRIEGEQHLRFCPLCVREDRETYGEAYWHRKHQIRNMSICTKHRCKLIESSVPAKSEQSYAFYPAESYVNDTSVTLEKDCAIIEFTAYLESVFDAPMDIENNISISSALYHGMRQSKYLKPSGRSRYTKLLANDMKSYYEKMGLCNIASMYQIQRALLGSRFDFSVVCQIAFFLGLTPEGLTAPSLTTEQVQQEQNSHYMKDAAPVDWAQLDAETAPVLELIAKSIYDGTANDNGRPERVSERLVYREMGLLGHQLEKLPQCRAIFERYTESYPESWARKLIWAYWKLKEECVPFYWSDIRELSGVKKKNLQAAIPYLINHTDSDTAKEIQNICN